MLGYLMRELNININKLVNAKGDPTLFGYLITIAWLVVAGFEIDRLLRLWGWPPPEKPIWNTISSVEKDLNS